MSIFDSAIEKLEKTVMESLGDRLKIDTKFNRKTLKLHTTTYWDGKPVSSNVFDMSPVVDEIIKRIEKGNK